MSNKPLRVAVVDDEESVRKALQRLLRAHGVEASTFASGVEFFPALSTINPDCVVLDLHMPELSGFEILELLPPGLPVVVITGHDSPEAYARAKRAPVYLRKPVDEAALFAAIHTAIWASLVSLPPRSL